MQMKKSQKSQPNNKPRRFDNSPLEVGEKLGRGRYTILKKISSGGYGMVYSAVSNLGKVVAIKEFLPTALPCRSSGKLVTFDNANNEAYFNKILSVFFTEAEVAAGIQTNNIVNIVDMFQENNTAYLVMPLEIGESLLSMISRHFKLYQTRVPDETIRQIFIAITDAVKTLHEHGLLHLDIKPANIWIRPNNEVVLLDLGACRSIQHYKDYPQPMKTTGYAAPEQHKPIANTILSTQTDIYAIAATMYACIEGTPPLAATERTEFDDKMISLRAGQVNYRLLNMIDKGLNLTPTERYLTALDMYRELVLMNKLSSKNELTYYLDNRLWKNKRENENYQLLDTTDVAAINMSKSIISK